MTKSLEKVWAILNAKFMLSKLNRESLNKRIVITGEALLLAQKRVDDLTERLDGLLAMSDEEMEEIRVGVEERIVELITELENEAPDLSGLAKMDMGD